MAEVRLGREESFDNLLKRFSKRVQQEGLLSEYRRRRYFEKPSVKRKRKQAARLRRAARR
ncbi:MAG: 30S ribosomal protein S21 [Dehalococcoidia bacterium]|nr:30S ribosomal protein S21 [Dehalococcoidia bacterium]